MFYDICIYSKIVHLTFHFDAISAPLNQTTRRTQRNVSTQKQNEQLAD